jgi:hypothetical protein
MRSAIRYVPGEIELDLAEPDLGHPDGRQILERHYRQSQQSRPAYSRDSPAFECMRHHQGTNPGLFLKKINGQWWAFHYDRSASCASLREPAPMSDEHKRQVDYWARAAEQAGWEVELQRKLDTGGRPDALIHGVVSTGVEVQRSGMTASAAMARAAKARQAKVLDVWFSTRTPPPSWAFRVPSVMEADVSWQALPPSRSATANGLRVIGAARCTPENFRRCPDSSSRRCGKFHPKDEPWLHLTVDDVAAQAPAGEIVGMRFYRSRRSDVFLVSRSSLTLYEELTGQRAALSASPIPETVPPGRPAGAVECQNVQPDRPALRGCSRCGENPAGPGGILCALCRLDIEASDGYRTRLI